MEGHKLSMNQQEIKIWLVWKILFCLLLLVISQCAMDEVKGTFSQQKVDHKKFAVLQLNDTNVLLIDKYECTNSEFQDFCRKYRRRFPASSADSVLSDPTKPATGFPLADAIDYCKSRGMRLLFESEWKLLMSRIPENQDYWWSANISAKDFAVFGQMDKGTLPVGSKKPTILGIYDLFGNAGEMVLPNEFISENSDYSYFYNYGGSYLGVISWLSKNKGPQKWKAKSIMSMVGCRCAIEYPRKKWKSITSDSEQIN